MSAIILQFTGQKCPIIYASFELVEWRGKERERWIVVTLAPDGTSSWHGPFKTRKDAEWLAGLLAESAAKARAERTANPLYDAIMRLPQEYRHGMFKAVQAQLEKL